MSKTERPTMIEWEEAAEILGISVHTLRARFKKMQVPHIRVGKLVRFVPEQIYAFIESGGTQQEDKKK